MGSVFISYSHESEQHRQRVLALADRLRKEGIDVRLDQYEPHPAEGWPRWTTQQLLESDFVLLVCTPTYRRRYDREEVPEGDEAVAWEALIADQVLYEAGGLNHKLIPAVFEDGAGTDVPLSLRAFTRYRLPRDYDGLYRRLTGQPATPPPPLGGIRRMPPERASSGPARRIEAQAEPEQESARPEIVGPPAIVLALANDRATNGQWLRNLPEERRAIQRQLGASTELKILHDALLDDVWDAFEDASVQGRIQVFHFAGHASESWLAFEDRQGRQLTAHAEGLASFLGRQEGLVLVFLNGCSTAAQVESLRRNVRAVVATTDSILDGAAADLAGRFYAGLRTKPLEQAFLDAVDFVKSKHQNDARNVIRRELVLASEDERVAWPWFLDCDTACKGWRLGQVPPPRVESSTELPERAQVTKAEIDGYLAKIESLYCDLRLAGFETKIRHPIALDDLYEPLDAVVDRSSRRRQVFHSGELAEGHDAEIPLARAFEVARKRSMQGVVLLGDPGSGKTTHLQQVLLTVERHGSESIGLPPDIVPVFLQLRKLRQLDAGLPAFIQQELHDPMLDVPEGFGERLCKRGRLLLLLDGLDEVANAEQRRRIARWIEDARRARPDNYFLVSCRFSGYTLDAQLDEHFLELHLRPMTPLQVKSFVRKWYEIVERATHEDPQQAELKAKTGAANLLKTLEQRQMSSARIYTMTHNPLLLTTICLVHRDRGELPDRRVVLYQDAVSVLLERWRRVTKDLPVTFPAREARQVLQPVAWWMHQEQGRTRAKTEELEAPVAKGLEVVGRGQVSARAFLETIRDESGLLTGWGVEEFGFMHLGFQEYLVARAIRARAFERPEQLRWLAARFGDGWWQEVTLLLLAEDDPPMFKQFMREVVQRPEFPEWARTSMMELCWNEAFGVSKEPFVEVLRETLVDASLGARQLAAAELLAKRMPALEGMEELLREHPAEEVRRWWRIRVQRESRLDTKVTPHGVELVLVPGGRFKMGSPESEKLADPDERPQHTVELASFWLARTPVTNAQYGEYLKANPQAPMPTYWGDRQHNQDQQPVVGVSWDDAKAYCRWAGLRLPTEAEWEHACRAGATTRYWSGNGEEDLKLVGWYGRNSGWRLHAVAEMEANRFGLYDMHGNVYEWCEDVFESYEVKPRAGDGLRHEPVDGAFRVVRGGNFRDEPRSTRSAYRLDRLPDSRTFDVGFRPAQSHS